MYDVSIIGAGIVGLSTAYQLQIKKPDTRILIIEKESDVAQHQTGNNSGVIHSGIYYKPGSLKAKNCIRGYQLLIDFAKKHNIPFELCGKIIVASDESELEVLHNIYDRGIENGLKDLKWLEEGEMKEIEPHLRGIKGVRVPQTGIIDYKAMSQKLKELLIEKGADFAFDNKVKDIELKKEACIIKTEKAEYQSSMLVNCAGLYSDKIARLSNQNVNLKIVPFRGEYYELKPEKRYLVKHLIYPVPDPAFPFLGVHFTRMIGGGVEAGPNAVLAYAREGYKKSDVNLSEFFETLTWPGFQKVAFKYWKTGIGEFYRSYSKAAFTKALQKLIPEVQSDDLIPGGAGVRAQACDKEGGLLDDFMILESKRVLNVCNAPSPAATSSLSIGETISNKIILQL
ncbi:L-2-hydroxyglutarate oxidase [Hyphobacterium sp. CCMP332]|nr:L-2-hydroxyglutarate oxidase [Hyphobacterium sp. CCMP332]